MIDTPGGLPEPVGPRTLRAIDLRPRVAVVGGGIGGLVAGVPLVMISGRFAARQLEIDLRRRR